MVEILGAPLPEVTKTFKKPDTHQDDQMFLDVRMPIECDPSKCTSCGICSEVCPVDAITLSGIPEFKDEKCIQCFCCIELCPNGALSVIRTEAYKSRVGDNTPSKVN
jgi:ferredoxin